MSGCCGQGPVIVSGAAAAPRLDVETQLMCDVLPDGTVAATVLVEPIYDTSSGIRVATRITDPATGADYTPVGEIQVCPTSPDCESPTTPVTSVGLCLADGTPIAVTIIRDCTGATTGEGWLNLVTGVWSAGAPPAGTMACGDARTITVSGTFCDVDGDGEVVGLVLVEYTYDEDGAIAAVRLVDAVTGDTYTPTGTVTVCPAGVAQPERDLLQLCDTADDGTITPFVRDYVRDENGAITGHSDYALDGTPYPSAGTVGACLPVPQADREVVCYRSPTAFGACTSVQIADVPRPSFVSASVVANPQNWPIDQANLNSTFNGNVTGVGGPSAPVGVIDCNTFQGGTGVVIDYLLAAPRDNVTAVRLWNSFGNVVTDNDGIGSATVTLYDEDDAVLFTGPLVACQYATSAAYATPCVTPVGNLDGVARVRLANLAKFPPSVGTVAPDIGWREIDLFSTYEATLTVDCGGVEVSALIEGDQPGLTYSEGKLTQVNGPHTLTFTAPGGATGRIITDNPAAFSALDFADGSVITVSGNGAVDFATEVVSGAATKAGYVTWDPVTGEPTVRDANSGEIVADADVVPCDTCCPGGTDGDTEPCRSSTTVTLCDSSPVDAGALVDAAATDPTPYFQSGDGVNKLPVLADSAPFWSGGTLTVAGPLGGETTPDPTHRYTAAVLTLPESACPPCGDWPDTMSLTVAATVTNDGPAAGNGVSGRWTLYNGATVLASQQAVATPVGASVDFSVTVDVSRADLLAGTLAIAMDLETKHAGLKAWTAEGFTVTLEFEQAGCGTTFLRTIRRDCVTGELLDILDTDYDGQPYTPVGEVGPCGDNPGACGDSGGTSSCSECDTVALCDVPADGDPVPFLRHICRDCEGTVTSVTDTELDAITPYTPTAVVTDCAAVKDCPTTYGTECWKFVEAQVAYDNTAGNCGTIQPGSMPACAGNWRITSWIIDGVEQITGPPVEFVAVGCGGNPNQFHGAWATALGTIDPSSTWQPAYNGTCLHFIRTASVDPNRVYGPMVMHRTEAPAQVFTISPAASRTETQFTKKLVEECDGSTTVQWLDADGNEIDEPEGDLTSCGASSTLGPPTDPTPTTTVVETGVRSVTGTAAQDLAAEFPDLQSVSLTVLAGSVAVTMSDGTGVGIPAGVTLTWSVATDGDTALGAAAFAGADAGASYLLNWTRK